MSAAPAAVPGKSVVDVNINVTNKDQTPAKTETSKGYDVVKIVVGALLSLGVILGAYVAQTNFQAFTKLGNLVAANPWLAAGVLASALVIFAAAYGLAIVLKPETAEAKEAKAAAKLQTLEKAVSDAQAEVDTWNGKHVSAETALATAKTALADALDALGSNTDDTKTVGLTSAKGTAEGAEKTAKTAVSDAKAALDAATAKLAEAKKALEAVKTPVAADQTKV